MESAKYHSPSKMTVTGEERKVAFFLLLFIALAGFTILTGVEMFVNLTGSALLNVTKFLLLKNFENFTILNSTAVHDFEKKYVNNI